MVEVSIIGIDLAERSFQLHGASSVGEVVFRKKLSRERLCAFLAGQKPCIVAMEACATAHFWARTVAELGHEPRLIPPVYVKPFVKRQKNDAADAEAIAEAAVRPTMRFVAHKSEGQQTRSMLFRTRDLIVQQRTQLINALRGHLAEFGVIVPQGIVNVGQLAAALQDPGSRLPQPVRDLGEIYWSRITECDGQILALEKDLRDQAKQDDEVRRLMAMPGIGSVCAMAIHAFAPPMETFKNGRNFAAWVGLTPKQHSTGGKHVLGRTSKMGQRDIRRLLIIGATNVVRRARRKGPVPGSWLARMLARKPPRLVVFALANKMARRIWAMLTGREDFRNSAMVSA